MATTTTKSATGTNLRQTARAKMDELAAQIKEKFRLAGEAARSALERHREAGKLLDDAHGECDQANRTWGKWVKKQFGITQQYANRLIKLHKEWAKVEPPWGRRASRRRSGRPRH